MMSSLNADVSELPAFAVYKSMKNKKRNKKGKNKGTNSEEIIITEDESCEVEEVVSKDKPSSSSAFTNSRNKKKRKSDNDSSKKQAGVEVIDVDENSSDIIAIGNEDKGKRKKRNLEFETEDEVICEDPVRNKVNGTSVEKKSSKPARKKGKKSSPPENSSEDQLEIEDEVICEDPVRNKVNGTSVEKKSSKPARKKGKKSSPPENSSEDIVDVSLVETEDEEEDYSGDSLVEARKLFSWLITPVNADDFFSNTWEKRPLHIKRGKKEYYTPVLSTAVIDKMLRNNNVQFTKNLDVTSYVDGKRETHNPDGRALPSMVWDYYKNGCSIRLLNPQTFIPKLALLNTSLQDYFGCFVGANVYLTPPDSQGFAPHYDDIEAFILQVEGRKYWRLYAPRSDAEALPRFSSGNFSQDEIGNPIMEITLEPGDLLYFPRGTIHQGKTVPGTHSLHITLSCFQRNTWGDLLEKVVTAALRRAMEEDLEFRKGLPHDYLNYMGIVHSDEISVQRAAFNEKIRNLTGRLFNHAPIDAAVDQMGKQFMHDAMPPILTAEERACTAFGDGYKMQENGKLLDNGEFSQDTKIKLLRAHILRLVTEEDCVRLYHCVDNSLEYHGHEPQFLEIPAELAPAVELLIRSYPEFIKISDLPLKRSEQKVTIVGDLWDRGLILTEKPLKKTK